MAVLEAPEGVEPRLVPREGLKTRRQISLELVLEPLAHGPGLEQPWEECRPEAEGIGQELAGGAEPREKRDGSRMQGEETEKCRAIPLLGEALDIVERHVGIGRGADLGQEARQDGAEQLDIPWRRGQRVEIDQSRGRLGESQPLEQAQRVLVAGRDRQQVSHGHNESSRCEPTATGRYQAAKLEPPKQKERKRSWRTATRSAPHLR